jgi:hypothetical protein
MAKKEPYSTQSIRRVNLSLPIVKTDSYEIYCTVPPIQSRQPSSVRPVTRQRPCIDINNSPKWSNQFAPSRLPARFKHLTGRVLVNIFVDMPPVATDSSSTAVDTISNALINSGYSGQTLRSLPLIAKHNKRQGIKDESTLSQTSSDDRLLFESVGSFEDPFMNRTKNGLWYNFYHPQFTAIKILHTRKSSKQMLASNDSYSRAPNISPFANLSQESGISSNERLYEKVEHLTKNYFPSIQQLRHSHPCPELINNRMHLHREEKRDFVPILSRPRVGR